MRQATSACLFAPITAAAAAAAAAAATASHTRTLKASFFHTRKVLGSKMVGCRISHWGNTPHVSCGSRGLEIQKQSTCVLCVCVCVCHPMRSMCVCEREGGKGNQHPPPWPSWSRWSRCCPPRPPRRSAGSAGYCRAPSACTSEQQTKCTCIHTYIYTYTFKEGRFSEQASQGPSHQRGRG